jgi:hypothetical protein
VSSAHGPLRHILLCYPGYAGGDDVYRDVLVDLFRQLPRMVELTVLAHPSVVDRLQQAVDRERAGARTTIVEAPAYLQYTVWAEDPYVVGEAMPGRVFHFRAPPWAVKPRLRHQLDVPPRAGVSCVESSLFGKGVLTCSESERAAKRGGQRSRSSP